jgi:hypothetical protein
MKNIFLLLIFFVMKVNISYASYNHDINSYISWFIFEGGVEVVDSSTILIVANGINKEIKLYGVCPTGDKYKDKLAELLARQLIDKKKSEIEIYNEEELQIYSAVLHVDNININKTLISKGYVLTGKQCNSNMPSSKKSEIIINTKGIDTNQKKTLPAISDFDIFDIDNSSKEHVRGYYRKDGTYVQPYTNSEPRQYSSDTYRASRDPNQPKTIYVRGYYRKNGTYVQPHRRSAPSRRSVRRR